MNAPGGQTTTCVLVWHVTACAVVALFIIAVVTPTAPSAAMARTNNIVAFISLYYEKTFKHYFILFFEFPMK